MLARVQREADQRHLDLGSAPYPSAGGLPAVTLSVMQPSGQRVLQIHVREVPRLLRAAIVIDDVGNDLEATRKLLALDYPLTFSVLPYVRYSRISAEEAHRSGHEVMLHLPMEPEPGAHASPGEGAILVGMNAAEVRKAVESDLEAVPFVAGVNNHMGSRATREAALMDEVMKTLAGHRLYFIDSRTTATSLALDTARRQHLPGVLSNSVPGRYGNGRLHPGAVAGFPPHGGAGRRGAGHRPPARHHDCRAGKIPAGV